MEYFTIKENIGHVVCGRRFDGTVKRICNFGDFQSDAMIFVKACKDGDVDEDYIEYLIGTYTDRTYVYLRDEKRVISEREHAANIAERERKEKENI